MTAWNYHIWNQALWELVMSCFLPGEAVTYRATAAPRAHQLEKLIQLWFKNGPCLQRLAAHNSNQPPVSFIHPPLSANHSQLPCRFDASYSSAG